MYRPSALGSMYLRMYMLACIIMSCTGLMCMSAGLMWLAYRGLMCMLACMYVMYIRTYVQGLKRSEQHALTDLFKSKVANSAESAYVGEKGKIQPIKKLERLMRSAI